VTSLSSHLLFRHTICNPLDSNSLTLALHNAGIKIDNTYSSYVRGLDLDVFVKEDGELYLDQVWPGAVQNPDFLHPNAKQWWATEITNFYKEMPLTNYGWT
jgi:alpha-D-xyloside xylohydrolase